MHIHQASKSMALNGATALIVLGRNDKNKDIITTRFFFYFFCFILYYIYIYIYIYILLVQLIY